MKRDDRPVWLLDIDGVINAYAYEYRSRAVWDKVAKKELFPYSLWVADGLVEFINKMHSSNTVEMRWCTTWGNNANEHFAPLFGLPEFVVCDMPEMHPQRTPDQSWKQVRAREILTEGRRLIWTEDTAIPVGFAEEIDHMDKDKLLVVPNPSIGLTPQDCVAIESFISGSRGMTLKIPKRQVGDSQYL
jgi:hypothetical protein